MRRQRSILCIVLLALLVCGNINAAGISFYFNGIYYLTTSSNTVEVSSVDYSLKRVTIPSLVSFNGTNYSVTAIGDWAFNGRSDLEYLSIPGSITYMGEYAFVNCGRNINVNIEDLEAWCSMKIFHEHSNPLSSSGALYINNVEIQDLVIPSGVSSIGKCAFFECWSIKSLTVPSGVKVIDSSAFENCKGLTSVVLPRTLEIIGGSSFEKCSNLSSIALPSSLTAIGINAFNGCSSLSTIDSKIQDPFAINENVFEGIRSNAVLNVPYGTKSVYQSTRGWRQFQTIVESTISPRRTIHVAKAGTLSNYILSSEKYQIEELTLTGEINGTDFRYLREMAGQTSTRSKYQSETEGILKTLDISGVKIVSGGSSYITEDRYNHLDMFKLEYQLVEDEIIPAYVFDDCTNLTTIKISNNVKSIGHYAFSNTAWYNNQPDGLVYIGKVLYGYKGEMPDNTKITIKDGTLGIGGSAFNNCKGLVSISIPNSVVRIGVKHSEAFMVSAVGAFSGCTGLNTITLPSNLSFIGCYSFYGCTGIKNITIPKNISQIESSAFNGCNLDYMSIQSTVSPLQDSSLSGCTLGALIWNPAEAISPDNLPNVNVNSNFLLYVKDSSYAPYKVRNVIVNGAANYIYLSDDGGNFYCPQVFTTKRISYSHNYGMTTGGSGKGWESIVLPFDVQKITHETKGELIPFAASSQGQDKKPFWLYNWSGIGFAKASSITANIPYIIAMPNQSTYNSDFILTGNVTFSAENVSIPVTPTYSGTFMPAYGTIKQSSSVYALNVVNQYVNVTGGYDAGSHFISNLRDVRPFEAYINRGSSTRSTISIGTLGN